MAGEFITALKASAVQPGTLVAINIEVTVIAFANVAEVTTRSKTHAPMQCSLAEGDLAGTTITCMCHGAQFDIQTGAVLAPPAPLPVKVYPVRIDGDSIQVESDSCRTFGSVSYLQVCRKHAPIVALSAKRELVYARRK